MSPQVGRAAENRDASRTTARRRRAITSVLSRRWVIVISRGWVVHWRRRVPTRRWGIDHRRRWRCENSGAERQAAEDGARNPPVVIAARTAKPGVEAAGESWPETRTVAATEAGPETRMERATKAGMESKATATVPAPLRMRGGGGGHQRGRDGE